MKNVISLCWIFNFMFWHAALKAAVSMSSSFSANFSFQIAIMSHLLHHRICRLLPFFEAALFAPFFSSSVFPSFFQTMEKRHLLLGPPFARVLCPDWTEWAGIPEMYFSFCCMSRKRIHVANIITITLYNTDYCWNVEWIKTYIIEALSLVRFRHKTTWLRLGKDDILS